MQLLQYTMRLIKRIRTYRKRIRINPRSFSFEYFYPVKTAFSNVKAFPGPYFLINPLSIAYKADFCFSGN